MRFRCPRWLFEYLVLRAKKTPYFHLPGYMFRYWLVPYKAMPDGMEGTGCGPVNFWGRPFSWVLQQFNISIRLHQILRSDRSDHFHDHPWKYVTWILQGDYVEVIPQFRDGMYMGQTVNHRDTGSLLLRRASDWHRLEVAYGCVVWTLFIAFKKQQRWGFLEYQHAKTYWRDYIAEHPERR